MVGAGDWGLVTGGHPVNPVILSKFFLGVLGALAVKEES